MDYDQNGNHLGDAGDPTIGTSAAEIMGSFPRYDPAYVSWSNPLGIAPGVMTAEAQTLSPYIINVGPQGQPQVSAVDTFNQGVADLNVAAQNAADAAAAAAGNLAAGASNLVKWGVVALIAFAVLETNKTVRAVSPQVSRKRRRK